MDALTLLPAEFDDPFLALLILLTSFLASATTAAFSIGGGLLLIAVMSAIMPIGAVVPVHGIIMVTSNAGRAYLLRNAVDWNIIKWFTLGGLVGAAIGAMIVQTLNAPTLRMAIACFVLFTQWGPKFSMPLGNRSFMIAGGLSNFITLFVGASGPFITAMLSKMSHYTRLNLTGTAAACMTLQHGIKVGVFVITGFSFLPWAPLIIASMLAGFVGTFLGVKLLHRLDETLFRSALKWVLTALAIYLLGSSLLEIVRTG